MKNEYYIATHFPRLFFFYITYMYPLPIIKKMLAPVQGTARDIAFIFHKDQGNIFEQHRFASNSETADFPVGMCTQ